MVLFALEVKIAIDGNVSLEIDNTEWPLDLKQPNSDEVRKDVIVSSENEEQLQDTGGDDIVNSKPRL